MMRAVLGITLLMATPVAGLELTCTHITKSTLKNTPLVRPVVQPGDTVRVRLEERASTLFTGDQMVSLALRTCPKGGTWTVECPEARALEGDVLSFYEDITLAQGPVMAIWGRKGARKDELVENVVLRCVG